MAMAIHFSFANCEHPAGTEDSKRNMGNFDERVLFSGVPFQDKDWLSLGINPSDRSQFILYASWTHFTRTTVTIQISHSTDGGIT